MATVSGTPRLAKPPQRPGSPTSANFASPPTGRQTPAGGSGVVSAAVRAAKPKPTFPAPGGLAPGTPGRTVTTQQGIGTTSSAVTNPSRTAKNIQNNPLAVGAPGRTVTTAHSGHTTSAAVTNPLATALNLGMNPIPPPGPGPGGSAAPAGPPPGAPDPGTPDTTFHIPEIPLDEAAKQNALTKWNTDQADFNSNAYQAALTLGDPTVMSQYGTAVVNPNSALAMAALRAQQAQENATNSRGRAGSLFSSLAVEDRGKIQGTHDRADLAAHQRFNATLAKLNALLTGNRNTYDATINNANADERGQAINNLPAPGTVAGTPKAPATTTKAPTGAGKAPKGTTKVGTKAGKTPVTKTKVPKIGRGRR